MASNKITKKDLNEMAVRSMAEQCCFSFERMQAVGFCYGMTKCFRKIHGDNNEEMAAALKNNLDFINTEPHMAAILQGLIVSMEDVQEMFRSTNGRFDLTNKAVAKSVIDSLSALNLLIVDEANSKVWWFDDGSRDFDMLTAAELENEKKNLSQSDLMKALIAVKA